MSICHKEVFCSKLLNTLLIRLSKNKSKNMNPFQQFLEVSKKKLKAGPC